VALVEVSDGNMAIEEVCVRKGATRRSLWCKRCH